MKRYALGLLLALALPRLAVAQTTVTTHISTGATLPAVCRVGDLWYKSTAFIGHYDCVSANTWRMTGSVLQTLRVGGQTVTIAASDVNQILIAKPALSGAGSLNLARGLFIESPQVATFNRAIGIDDQTGAGSNSLILEATTPNSGYTRIWAKGMYDQFVSSSSSLTITANDYLSHRVTYTYSGGNSSTTVTGSIATTNYHATAAQTGGGVVGAAGQVYLNTDKDAVYASAVQGYVEVDSTGSVTGTSYIAGVDAEYGHYGGSTQPLLTALVTNGGIGAGSTVTNLYDVYVSPLWDTSGTITNRVGVQIDAVTEGVTSNWALKYTNGGSQVAGITGGGALVDAPENDSFGATITLTPAASSVRLTCTDGAGCAVTLGETGVKDGQIVRFVNVSANTCNFADTAGVTELAGAFAAGQWDTLVLQYISDRWVELSRSNN